MTRIALQIVLLMSPLAIGILGPRNFRAEDLPFGVGERAQYKASYLVGRVGTGILEIPQIDTIRGHSVLHLRMTIGGGIPGARIDERLESWLDRDSLYSHRYLQRTRYPRFSRDRARNFFPDGLRWAGHTNGRAEAGDLPTARPLDDLAFLFHVRTMDLEVGQEYVLDRYWNPTGNPVRLKVLREETVEVPAGRFRTIVVQPIIKTSSLFAEDGEAYVYLSTGPRRELVMLRARVSIGTLTLRLESYQPGG